MYSDIARRFALHVAVFQTLVWRFWATRMLLRLGVPAAAVLMSQGEAAFTCCIFHRCVKFCNLSQDWCWVVQIKQNWHGVEILIDNEYAVLLTVVMKVMVPMTLKMMVDDDEQWWMIFWIRLRKLLMELVLSQCNFSVQTHWRTMEWMLVKQMVKVTKKKRNVVQSEGRTQIIPNDLQIYRQMFRLNTKRPSQFIRISAEYGKLSFTSF